LEVEAVAANVVEIWKMNWPLVFEVPFRVSVVESAAFDVVNLYTPGTRVWPPRSVLRV
jgi:hypothetical protein